MTIISDRLTDGAKLGRGAQIRFTVSEIRDSTDQDAILVQSRTDVKVDAVTGAFTTPSMDPGPYVCEIRWGAAQPFEKFAIVVPESSSTIRLWPLIDDLIPYEPPVVSLVKQYLDETKVARDQAVLAADGVAEIAEDVAQVALDRAAAEAARDAAQGFAGDASESRGLAAVSAVSASDSATLAGQRDTSAASHASNASASATAAGQSEAAAAQHKEDAEAAADLAVSTAAGIQDVAADAAQVAADRIAVADDRTAVSADRQAAVDARSGAIAAQGLAEDARDDAAETKTEVDNTKAAIDATLDAYGTQFTADKNASQQAVVDATVQANRAGSEADRAEQAADDIAAGAVADGAVSTVKIQDGAVTKAKTSPGVQTSLDKADTSVQEGDSRLTNARPPTAHSHAVADVTGLQGVLDSKAPTSHSHSMAQVTGLVDALAAKMTETQAEAIATAAIAAWVDNAPESLDTLAELATALGNDPNFATTVMTAIGQRAMATHGHLASEITDATTVGRNVIKAADAAAARSAIGAGTGNGNSNLALGTTSATAMRGDAYQVVASLPGSPVSGTLYCIPE